MPAATNHFASSLWYITRFSLHL